VWRDNPYAFAAPPDLDGTPVDVPPCLGHGDFVALALNDARRTHDVTLTVDLVKSIVEHMRSAGTYGFMASGAKLFA